MTVAPFIIFPTGNSGTVCENFCHAMKASGGVPSPVGNPVFAAITRANRSGKAVMVGGKPAPAMLPISSVSRVAHAASYFEGFDNTVLNQRFRCSV